MAANIAMETPQRNVTPCCNSASVLCDPHGQVNYRPVILSSNDSGRLRRCTGDLSALHQALPDCWDLGDFGHWLWQDASTLNIPNMTEMMA